MPVKRLLLYGGAFNPPHRGHIALLSAAAAEVEPELALVMPSKLSPHKQSGSVPFWHRYAMCRCFLGIKGVRRSPLEFFLKGKSYTVRTVGILKRLFRGAEIYILIGTDMLATFTEWREYKRLLAMCVLVAGSREDDDMARVAEAAALLEKDGGRVIILNNRAVEISSTEIRREIAETGKSRHITDEVEAYIERKALYTDNNPS